LIRDGQRFADEGTRKASESQARMGAAWLRAT